MLKRQQAFTSLRQNGSTGLQTWQYRGIAKNYSFYLTVLKSIQQFF